LKPERGIFAVAVGKLYAEVRPSFSEKELADLTCAVATINAWNRLAISSRTIPGTYQPAKTALVEA
jgi:alkylhydroperoxidase family enzyme